MPNLPGLNYDSKLSVDDLSFFQNETEKAILDRFKLTYGGASLAKPRHGVVDSINPTNLVSSETTRPLLVYSHIDKPLFINVTAGVAVAPNGTILVNPLLVEDLELARTNANDIVVVYLENEIVDSPPIRKTRYNVNQPTRRTQNPAIIRSALLSDFSNAAIFTPARLSNIVVIAMVTVALTTTSSLELQFDYTSNNYNFNRPWFSPVDAEHRSMVGSGIVTDTNPHGTTINDLSSGNLTLYDQLLSFGQVIAKDNDIKGVPGTICFETITTTRVLVDGTGITSESRFGGIGASYVVLAKHPVGITAFYLENHPGRALGFDWIVGTRLVVIPAPEILSSTAVIEYTQVLALEPPSQILSNVLSFSQPDTTRELISTGGLALTVLSNPFIDFDGTGPVPRDFKLYVNSDGTILRSPQTIQTPIKLDDIGTTLFSLTASMFGAARVSIGLASANSVPSMAISIRLYGKDTSGNTITEDVAFSGSTWVSVSLPGNENTGQYVKSATTFATLTALQVLSRSDDGPNSVIQVFAELETETTLELNRLAWIASLSWDGLAIQRLKDRRKIVQVIPEPGHRFVASAEWQGLGGTNPTLVASEDFGNPKYRESAKGVKAATQATFVITLADSGQITAGDQITIVPTGKTLTAITAGIPNRTLGEYLAAASESDTRDDMILTLNFGAFASGVTATTDPLLNNLVVCTVNAVGAAGNGDITEPVEVIPTAIITADAAGGIDAFAENFTPRHQDYISSDVPSPSTYDVQYVRARYRTVAFAIGGKPTLRVVTHRVAPPYSNIQVRIRVATDSNPEWLPWEVMTGSGMNFSVTKAFNISKCQLEVFGKCSGFSLFEST